MESDSEGFLSPVIDEGRCIECSLCMRVCPVNKSQAEREGKTSEPDVYACINEDEKIRAESSSGGIFTIFAQEIIKRKGVVFGAGFELDCTVTHSFTETHEGLSSFRGSKYVQSEIGSSFIAAKKYLDSGRLVLFSGTPCQIGGLISYLQKPYANLYCVDIICHGVPSSLLWRKYVTYHQQLKASSIQKVSFRNKRYGWKNYSMYVGFEDESEYCVPLNKDSYLQLFLHDVCLRNSCYECGFKTINRQADITLADFWGVERVCSEMFDDRGTSLVFIHSLKGKEIFDSLTSKIKKQQIDVMQAIAENVSMIKSVYKPDMRKNFYKVCIKADFQKLVNLYVHDSTLLRIAKVIYRIYRKMKKILLK
jgi:coenzyme F420-reducing hydrogenase beta subunit